MVMSKYLFGDNVRIWYSSRSHICIIGFYGFHNDNSLVYVEICCIECAFTDYNDLVHGNVTQCLDAEDLIHIRTTHPGFARIPEYKALENKFR